LQHKGLDGFCSLSTPRNARAIMAEETYSTFPQESAATRRPHLLFHRRCSAGSEECPLGSLTQEARAYGQVRGVMPFSCAYLAADASTRGRTSA